MNITHHPIEVLDFWFGEDIEAESWRDKTALWWSGSNQIDAMIREQFGLLISSALSGELDHWAKDREETLALVLLLDQFCRNAFRGSAKAFAGDAKALGLVHRGLKNDSIHSMAPIHLRFMVMPLMHSESIDDQDILIATLKKMSSKGGDSKTIAEGALPHAVEHRQIIERFGRFPHRNKVLGRASSEAELAYLSQGAKRYGQ